MAKSDTKPQSALAEAALALDHELARFEDLAEAAAHVKLNSEKNIERATEALQRAAESQDRINGHVQRLVGAVQEARARQETDAASLLKRAHEIAARRTQFNEMLQRMGALGQLAREAGELLRGGVDKAGEAEEKMDHIAREAESIGAAAREQDMEDLERQADSLRQQVLAAKNKMLLLVKKGAEAPPEQKN